LYEPAPLYQENFFHFEAERTTLNLRSTVLRLNSISAIFHAVFIQ
jgi:hypothetical protein